MSDRVQVPARSPIEIMSSVATIVEQLYPEIAEQIGSLAAAGVVDPSARQWSEDLSRTTERLSMALGRIMTPLYAISALPDLNQSNTDSQAQEKASVVETPLPGAPGAVEKEDQSVKSALAETTSEAEEPDNEAIKLTDTELHILDYARSHTYVKVESMRKELTAISMLSDEDYRKFKLGFEGTREKILKHLLATEGVTATWVQSGINRGRKYSLVITDEAATTTIDKSFETSTAEQFAFNRRASRFGQDIVDWVIQKLNESPKGEVRLRTLDSSLSEYLGVDSILASGILKSLAEKGHYHTSHSNGSTVLSLKPSEANPAASSTVANGETTAIKEAWTREHDIAIRRLLRGVLNLPGNRGVELNRFFLESKLSDEGVKLDLVKSLARLANELGVVTSRTEKKPRSRAKGNFVTVDVDQRRRLQSDFDAMVNVVKEHFA